MFEQHPVPQQISSYQFRLVGDMTIKQFFQVAAGAVIALIVYGLPLPGFLKWPAIVISALSGAAFAFLPIQDRPLEQWIVAFIRSIYSPTYFVWVKQDSPPAYFKDDSSQAANAAQTAQPTTSSAEEEIKNMKEAVNLKPEDQVVPDFISGNGQAGQEPQGTQSTPDQQNTPQPQVNNPQAQMQENAPAMGQNTNVVQQNPGNTPNNTTVTQPQTNYGGQVNGTQTNKQQAAANQNIQATQPNIGYNQIVSPVQPAQNPEFAPGQAQFSRDAAPPMPPENPNIIRGQVMDNQGHVIEGAIVEIRDSQGRPVRALKTNAAGHFQTVTPLANGSYTMVVEKQDYEFQPTFIEASGQIINPIAIRAN